MRHALAVLLLYAVHCLPTAAAAERPNVLLICVDDLKPLLGCYGDEVVQSPNIDRLAARGLRFDRAYCNQAVCAPSRNALLTGLRPQTIGVYDLGTNFRQAAPDAVTLPQHFKANGYRTEGLGKIFHVGHGNHDDTVSWSVPHWSADVVRYARKEGRAPRGLTREEARFANVPGGRVARLPRGAAYESADVPDSTYPDGQLADEAIRRLKQAAETPDQPYFLAVGFVKPHLPFCAPTKYWEMYDRANFKLPEPRVAPEGAPTFAPTDWGELRQYAGIPENGGLPEDLQRTLIHGYHAAVSYMDAQVGRVIDTLDATGLAKNSVIVLWGDHGWHLGDHGMWCKHTNYEQAARIPLIVIAPNEDCADKEPMIPLAIRWNCRVLPTWIWLNRSAAFISVGKPGAATDALIESVDIYPTLCELAGLPVPDGLDGSTFVPVLTDPSAATKEAVFHVYPRGRKLGRAMRTARYRLVEWKHPGANPDTAEVELYDYERDPSETKNLADDEPGTVNRLRAILADQPEARPQIAADRESQSR